MEVNSSVILQLVAALRECTEHVRRSMVGQPLDELDVRVLALVGAANGTLKPSQAAAELEVAFPSITRHVRLLQEKQLVSIAPDEDDGRSYAISLTEAGATALRRYRDNLVTSMEPAVKDWSAAEMSDLAKQVTRLAESLTTAHAEARTARTPLWPTEQQG
jgi:DNA-binding MarR family transcriptional regulator